MTDLLTKIPAKCPLSLLQNDFIYLTAVILFLLFWFCALFLYMHFHLLTMVGNKEVSLSLQNVITIDWMPILTSSISEHGTPSNNILYTLTNFPQLSLLFRVPTFLSLTITVTSLIHMSCIPSLSVPVDVHETAQQILEIFQLNCF